MVLVAAMLTLMLGIGFTATQELLSPHNFRPIGSPDSGRAFAGLGAPPIQPEISAPRAPPRIQAAVVDSQPALPVPIEVVEELAQDLRQAGDAGRCVAVFGATHGVGTSLAAITLARSLVRDARVVLVDLALAAPNLSVISTDPDAPGIIELVAEEAGPAEVIMKDQLSAVHVIAAGRSEDPAEVLNSPRLAMTIEALAQAYDHIIIDAGAISDAPPERVAALAPTGVLVVTDPEDRNSEAADERLHTAGFEEVAMLVATHSAMAGNPA
jgi:Mrp family chromosome partitioning ATPase